LLDGQGGEPGVLNQVSVGPGPAAKIRENRPVAGAGLNDLTIGLPGERIAEGAS
jgi:hypothetical protein